MAAVIQLPNCLRTFVRRLILCCGALPAACLISTSAYAATDILIVHSYSQDYAWTRGQHEGFLAGFAGLDPARAPVFSTEYLDTKRRGYDEAYAGAMADNLRIKYAGYRPAAIYVTDDNALLFARDYLREIFPLTPVFFSGINDYAVRATLDPRFFTGVFEKKEVRPNLEWLLRFDPALHELVFIGDGSNTDKAIVDQARKDLVDFPQIHARFIAEKNIDRVLAALREKPSQYVILTTLGGITDAQGTVQPLAQTLRAVSEAGIPVLSMEDGYVNQGVLGGYVTRGPEQGGTAAQLVRKYLDGRLITDIEPVLKSPNAYLFDDAVLQRHDLELQPEMIAKATLLNPRPRFVDTHRTLILATLCGLAAALFGVILFALFVVSRKNGQLSIAQQEAESANRAKSQFLANMSHEIRTPLTSIIGFGEMLMERGMNEGARVDALPSIVRNGHHLLELINNILDLAKVESGSVALEKLPIKTSHLLRELTALVAVRAKAKSVSFELMPELPLPAIFVSDSVRLKQILVNFLSNAVKFTERGSVHLSLRYSADSQTLHFIVSDTGIGMTHEQLSRLFKRFVQADVSTTRRFGGTGLGLHLCQQLAVMLGARIETQSEAGKGSRFTLSLPLSEAPGEMLTSIDELRIDQSSFDSSLAFKVPSLRGRVLVAEDGRDNQRLIAAYLQQAGLEVKIVGNGREAVECALDEHFDLVLMDIQMPVMDGVTAMRALRVARYGGPIVALTANVMKSEVQQYRELGCKEVLSKPIERAKFYATLERLLERGSGEAMIDDVAYDEELATLAAEFRARLPAQLASIAAALAQGDWKALRELAHDLKGTAGAFGFPELTGVAADVEAAALAGSYVEAETLCATLNLTSERLLVA